MPPFVAMNRHNSLYCFVQLTSLIVLFLPLTQLVGIPRDLVLNVFSLVLPPTDVEYEEFSAGIADYSDAELISVLACILFKSITSGNQSFSQ